MTVHRNRRMMITIKNISVTNLIHNITKGPVGSYISFKGDDTTEAAPWGFSILLKL